MNLLQALLKSKKLQVTIANVIIVIANEKLGLGIDPSTIFEIVAISCAYIVGQGLADTGKEAATRSRDSKGRFVSTKK